MDGVQAQAGTGGGALLEVLALRSGVAYREAERLRRRIGSSKEMALSSMSSEEYAAVRLLIGTWDSIAALVRAGNIPQDSFFQSNPVGHMWDALEDAIRVIQKRSKGKSYAENFRWLNGRFRKWLEKPTSRKYRTAARLGTNAHFG